MNSRDTSQGAVSTDTSAMPPEAPVSRWERAGTMVDGLRDTVVHTFRLAILMAQGAYLLQERRRLFARLGELAFDKIRKGTLPVLPDEELSVSAREIDRLTRKLEIEEKRIHKLCSRRLVR